MSKLNNRPNIEDEFILLEAYILFKEFNSNSRDISMLDEKYKNMKEKLKLLKTYSRIWRNIERYEMFLNLCVKFLLNRNKYMEMLKRNKYEDGFNLLQQIFHDTADWFTEDNYLLTEGKKKVVLFILYTYNLLFDFYQILDTRSTATPPTETAPKETEHEAK